MKCSVCLLNGSSTLSPFSQNWEFVLQILYKQCLFFVLIYFKQFSHCKCSLEKKNDLCLWWVSLLLSCSAFEREQGMFLRAGILIEAASGQQLAGSGCPSPAPTRQARRKGCCIHSPDLWVPSVQWTKGTPHFISAGSLHGCQKINWAGKSVNLKWIQSKESFLIKISIIIFSEKHFIPLRPIPRVWVFVSR